MPTKVYQGRCGGEGGGGKSFGGPPSASLAGVSSRAKSITDRFLVKNPEEIEGSQVDLKCW